MDTTKSMKDILLVKRLFSRIIKAKYIPIIKAMKDML